MASTSAAGSDITGFTRELFMGRLNSKFMHPFPEPKEEDLETLKMLVDPFSKFMENENDAAKNDRECAVDEAVKESLKPMGAYGMMTPEEYGGVGLDHTGYARLVEVVGAHDLGLGIHLGASQSIGYKGIVLYGNKEQKEKYLPKLASGEHVAAFCLTEDGSGSDAQSIKTRAVPADDGSGDFILNGGKIWISNGGLAEVFTVFAQTPQPDGKDKMTAFIVERGFGGITNGAPEKKMGINCSNTTTLNFDDTRVPAANVLGEVGGGFKVAMGILNQGRFGMGGALTGTMKTCMKYAAAHAAERTQFGKKIGEFEMIQGKLAGMATRLYATESLAYAIAGNMDRGVTDFQMEAACGKVFSSECAWWVADETLQILGGLGFMREYPIERIVRDLRIFRIFEGSSEILRLFVALYGVKAAGDDLKPLQKALKNPLANLGAIVGPAVSIARARIGAPEKPSLDFAPAQLRPAADVVEDCAARLGAATRELLLKHGKGIVDRQLPLERAASAAMEITAATAAIARATRAVSRSTDTAALEVSLANGFALEAGQRVRALIRDMTPSSEAGTTIDPLRRDIAKSVIAAGEYPARHPLGF
ncbi:hypothetical protein FNF27_04596 [Cafeteria roenbergensis]|nr:hypothetical protein FNF31_07749 [Cafeteria roenbergensis]KAA0153802.1 hypothetical protein FNF29_02791 [Cafeteria roenbergensis]KAA0173839.1 hypothetical protein FNF27_04596 [Cafeteria roenbergensis]|eukprot:KAA0153802.1 hypothetical protein FNF29_02791 [Cafeteria roenbergensis]